MLHCAEANPIHSPFSTQIRCSVTGAAGASPCGESTVVSIVFCQCAYCCPEPVHGKKLDDIHFFGRGIVLRTKCELSYNVLGMTQNCIPPSELLYQIGSV